MNLWEPIGKSAVTVLGIGIIIYVILTAQMINLRPENWSCSIWDKGTCRQYTSNRLLPK